ncbi:MAG: hypothetical protein WCM76_07895 [Bacteroidota bacterium]
MMELEDSYSQFTAFTIARSNEGYKRISNNTQCNPVIKALAIKKADSIMHIASRFFALTDKVVNNEHNLNIGQLQQRYIHSLDSMNALIDAKYRKQLEVKDYMIVSKETTSMGALKMLQSDMAILEYQLLDQIYSGSVVYSDYFFPVLISVHPTKSDKKNACSFDLQINQSENPNSNHTQDISIDSVECNGKLIVAKSTSVTRRIVTVGSIYLDSLEAGNYSVKGTYKEIFQTGNYALRPFRYNFRISK